MLQVTNFCSGTQLTGQADATGCIQTAVDSICNSNAATIPGPGGVLSFAAGIYRIDGTVLLKCSGLELAGAGAGDRYPQMPPPDGTGNGTVGSGTEFVAGHRTDDLAMIKALVDNSSHLPSPNGPNNFANGLYIHDITMVNNFGSVSNGRSGAFLEINYWQQVLVARVNMYAPCIGAKVNGGFFVTFEDVMIKSYEPTVSGGLSCAAFRLTGSVANTYSTLDVVAFNRTMANAGSHSVCYDVQDRVQTVWWTNTTCETNGYALKSSCPTMSSPLYCPGFFTLHDFEAESFGTGDNMIDLTDLVDGFKMSDSWLRGFYSGAVANNLVSVLPGRFPPPTGGNLGVTMSNNWLKFAGGSCLYISSAMTTIANNHIYGCGKYYQSNQTLYPGVEIRANRAVVTGNQFCGGDWLNDVTWPMNAGLILPGVDYTIWTSNLFSYNTAPSGSNNACSAGIVNQSAGGHNVTSPNVGP
ncbi:hypothetical protein [Sphingomonas crusticola]|uniref:hypothetical protein n=1 Tax=Sphingomonas crusticola TaxID=1697973 RepID=UPI000E266871|nr:hypothetical protein [Sphingomonas crusticola]